MYLIQEALDLKSHILKVSSASTPGLELQRLAYGTHDSQYILQCNHPDYPPIPEQPILVYFHGGGWQFGKPDHFRVNAMELMKQGFQVFLACHRKLPFYGYRAMQEDLRLMRQMLDAWMTEQNWGNKSYVLGGVSSGGHLSLQFALDPKVKTQNRIAGIFTLAAPIELNQMMSTPTIWWLAGMHGSERFQEANPITHLTAESNFPVLILHGARDGIVPVKNASSFRDIAAQESRLKLEVHIYESMNHMDLAGWPFPPNPVYHDLFSWLESIKYLA